MQIKTARGIVNSVPLNLDPFIHTYYGIDIVNRFADKVKEYGFDKVFFVSEANVYNLHGKQIYQTMVEQGIESELILIANSEMEKNIDTLDQLCSLIIQNRISKDSIIISFGGGIVGNVTGLAAALIYRGVRYIEIPTTFLGQTDSSISHKQAVNGHSGKNQLGVYYAPLFIWADLTYIGTEPIRYINAGIVEGIKNAFINDKTLLNGLKKMIKFDSYSQEELFQLFEFILKSKNAILSKDNTERKSAVTLEYGHTFGHAMEFLSEGAIIHGEAVAMGMCIAAEIGYLIGTLSNEEKEMHYQFLTRHMYHPTTEDEHIHFAPQQILDTIQNDNKRTKDGVKYVVLNGLGECLNPDGDYQIKIEKEIITKGIRVFLDKYEMSTKTLDHFKQYQDNQSILAG